MENTLWANTVLASGTALGLVVYTGRETRSVMNNSAPRSKTGLLDLEINNLTKVGGEGTVWPGWDGEVRGDRSEWHSERDSLTKGEAAQGRERE